MPAFGLDITLEDNIDEMIELYGNMRKKMLPRATRSALNKGMAAQFTGFTKVIRKKRKIKLKDLKRFVKKRPVTERTVDRMESLVKISGRKVGLINFVVGSKTPRKQQGIRMGSRRKIKIEIKPGKRKVMKHGFIAKSQGGRFQVFRRKGKGSLPIVRQTVQSIARFVSQSRIAEPIVSASRAVIRREFFRVLNLEADKFRTKGVTKRRTG